MPLELVAVLSWYVPKVLLDAIRTAPIDLQRVQGWRVGFVPEGRGHQVLSGVSGEDGGGDFPPCCAPCWATTSV